MPNIKISDLESAVLPLSGAETFFEVQTVAAGQDVSRKVSLDDIIATTGLDATFVTVTANAQLPNERILTEGAGITIVDGGPNSTITISATTVFPLLAPDGSESAPSYSFSGASDMGMFRLGGNLGFTTAGTLRWAINNTELTAALPGGPLFRGAVVASATVPTIMPNNLDINTGLGWNAADQLSLVAGGVEGVRVDETAGAIQVIIDPGLTNTSDATPPLAFGGGTVGFRSPDSDQIFVILSGAAQWKFGTTDFRADITDGPALRFVTPSDTVPSLLPNQNDIDTGIGSAGADILSLIAGGVQIAQATSVGNNQFAIAQSGSSSVPELTSLADPDTGFGWTGVNTMRWIGGGTRAWNFSTAKFFSQFSNGPGLLNEIATDVNPTVVPDHSDPNTGMGHPSGSDELSLIAGGIEAMRIEETASFVTITYFGTLVVPTASAGAASVGFDGDLDTGYFSPVDDAFAITTGGIEAVRYAELSSHVIQTNENHTGLTASVTQTQVGGLALLSSYNEVSTVANSDDALTAFAVAAGDRLVVVNNGGNQLQLFPAVGDNIGGGIDTAIIVESAHVAVFLGRDGVNWDTLFNGDPNIQPSPGGASIQGVWEFSSNTAEADPGAGNFRLDNATVGLTTEIFISQFTEVGFDADNILALISSGDRIYLQNAEDATQFLLFDVTANVDNGGWFSIAGTVSSSGAAFDEDKFGVLLLFGGGAIPGTTTNSMLRFDGSSYIEETQIQATAAGVFSVLDAGLTDSISISHNGAAGTIASTNSTALNFTGVATQYSFDNNVVVAGDITVAGGNRLIVLDSLATDSIVIDHDGVDGNVVMTLTTDLNFSGVTGVYNFDAPIRLPNASGTAAAPAYAFEPATNEGMFRSALGVGISFTSAEQLRINGSLVEVFSDSGLRIRPNIGTDLITIFHDGTNTEIASGGATDFVISGVGLERFFLSQPNLAMLEKSAAPGDEVGIGQFWVRDDTPNTAMFTNDTGVDKSLVNDAVQARRTTDYLLTTAFADVTLDTTDVETDSAVLEHSGTTDNIIVGQPGTYEITYGLDINPEASGSENIRCFGRVRINDAGVDIPGSLASTTSFEDGSLDGDFFYGRLQCSFIVTLAASDFLTLQLMQIELDGAGDFTAEEVTVTAKRLL